MNIVVCYNIARFLEKTEQKSATEGWTLERDGAVFLPYRWLLQALNRQENVVENLDEMAGLGLVEIRGDGSRGNKKEVGLALAGRGFLENFSNGVGLQALIVSPDDWVRFFRQVAFHNLDRTVELSRVLRQYRGESKVTAPAVVPKVESVATDQPSGGEIGF